MIAFAQRVWRLVHWPTPGAVCPRAYRTKVAAAVLGGQRPGSPLFIALRRVVLLLCARIARGSNLFPTARGVRALRGRKPSPLWRPGIFPFRRRAAAFLEV